MATISEPGYSATVEAALHIGDQVLPLAKVGRNTCVLQQPIKLPKRHGEIVVHIDGHVHRTPVELLEPLTPDRRHVAYRRVVEVRRASHSRLSGMWLEGIGKLFIGRS